MKTPTIVMAVYDLGNKKCKSLRAYGPLEQLNIDIRFHDFGNERKESTRNDSILNSFHVNQ